MQVNNELAIELCAKHCELHGLTVSHPPIMVRHFTAQVLSESLGIRRDQGQYLVAFNAENSRIVHVAVDDETGKVEIMEDL